MNKLLPQAALLVIITAVSVQPAHAQSASVCAVAWNQLINTEVEHRNCFRVFGSDVSHFTMTWNTSDSWNGTDGYMRWSVTRTMGEDDDGYWINHPSTTARPIFISFVARVGPTWWARHREGYKFAMFYNTAGTNPRPTVFTRPIYSPTGAFSYLTLTPAEEAGGQGCDQFGNCNHNQSSGFPNHTYKEGPNGHNQWYFIVMSLELDRTKTYIWSQDGALSGLYAQSLPVSSTLLSSWNAQTWRTVRLLAYIEATTAGDAGAYMDIGHIRLTQSLPYPPAGFVTGGAPRPGAPTNIRVD